tara:strand:- start:606 stop:869 length:264 start_codon:yes stop_codon:yes gene_type:complete
MPKKPVSLRMNAKVHAAAKRRAKDLGMNSLADYVEALISHDLANGFDIQVTYRAGSRPDHKALNPRKKSTDSVGMLAKKGKKKRVSH